ncbi:MAG: PAS domain S-box protein [Methanomicrobiales archaeon]|nr:PAS domain S-box protein [Methanomicrobiales archaeon]
MKIYIKTILIILATVSCLLGSVIVISDHLIMANYADLERSEISGELARASDELAHEIAILDQHCVDWASWDDTYAFAEDHNQAYIDSNLVPSVFENFDLALFMIIDAEGTMVYGGTPADAETITAPDPVLCDAILADPQVARISGTDAHAAGILDTPAGMMLVSSRPILTSSDEGPVRGVLLMARHLDDDMAESLSGIAHLNISFHPVSDPAVPSSVPPATAGGYALLPGSDTISGYAAIPDIHGTPVLFLQAEIPRTIVRQGEATTGYLVLTLLATGIAFGLITLILLKIALLDRIALFGATVSEMGDTKTFSGRLPTEGNDEISLFAGAVNGMLQEIETAQKDLTESRDRYHRLFNSGDDYVLVFTLRADGSPGTIREANDRICSDSGHDHSDLYGMPAERLLDTTPFPLLTGSSPDSMPLVTSRLLTSGGKTIPIEVSLHRIRLDGDDAVLAIARDITARIAAETELARYRSGLEQMVANRTEELSRANRALGEEILVRKQAEEELRESKEYLSLIFDSVQTGIVVIDAEEHHIVGANPVACRMIGADEAAITGHICHSFICPQQRGSCPLDRSHTRMDNAERTLLTAAGDLKPILKTAVPFTFKGHTYYLESFVDITERKEAEKRLEEYRMHLEEMVNERTAELLRITKSLEQEIAERRELERQRLEAYGQIDRNMEQFAILNDHIRNPLQVIMGLASLQDDETARIILDQGAVINDIVTKLDQGWIESDKIRAFLKKYYHERF